MIYHQNTDSPVIKINEYCFRCTYDGDGEIYNRESKLLWSFRSLSRNRSTVFPLAFFRLLPDFVFYDTTQLELLTIMCERRYPLTRFVMIENGFSVCTIRKRSILQNEYSIEFNSELNWTFQMPMFTVFYNGVSENGAKLRVRMERHDTWYVQIPSSVDNLRLVAALAFIHREQQR